MSTRHDTRRPTAGRAGTPRQPPPPGPLTRLGANLVLFPRRILAGMVLLMIALGALGTTVVPQMTNEVGDPNAPSAVADLRIEEASGSSATPSEVVLLLDLPRAWPEQPSRRRVFNLAQQLESIDGVTNVASAVGVFPLLAPVDLGLVSEDRMTALVSAGLTSEADPEELAQTVIDTFADRSDVTVGGEAVVSLDIDERIAADLTRAELFAFPILLLLGFWIFRGLVAAFVPLAVGGLAILGTLGGLRIAAEAVTLSEYVLNLVIGLGLGLAIDYCLFIISRYREEVLIDGYGTQAVIRTVVRAGHTVLFSAATVALALSTLLLFPQQFLYSMGIGGVLVTLVAALLAVTVLPVVLVLLGPRIDSLALPRWRKARVAESEDPSAGRWYALSRSVMRHARIVFPLTLVAAALLAYPALNTTFGDVDQTSLPTSSTSRQVSDRLASDFRGGGDSQVYLSVSAGADEQTAVDALAGDAAGAADATAGSGAATYVGEDVWVVPIGIDSSSFSAESGDAVRAVRSVDSELPFLVGGDAASFVDLKDSIGARLPWALLIIALAVLGVMFLLTHSVVLSIKTLLLNTLNVAMTFGVLVWIFEYGNLEGLLGFESTGRIDLTQPILVAIIAFGLSTDYGIFLFARIMEYHDAGDDDIEAVSRGVGRSGRIISSAALLLCIAIGAFSTSSILFIKQLGVGAAVAVFLDATLVRAFLVPSAMQLMGSANWWSPRWLLRLVGTRRVH